MSRARNWPGGLRWIVRRVKPSWAMDNLTAYERKTGWRYSIICTNIPGSGIGSVPSSHHPQYIDVAHRAHAVVETGGVPTAKAMGLCGLPSKIRQVNCGWVIAANIAASLAVWTGLLGCRDNADLREADPNTLRYRIWHIPARLVRQRTLAMRLPVSCWLVALLATACSCVVTTTISPGPACAGRTLTPGSDVQAAISDATPNTNFCFDRGVYHISVLIPKSGDTFNGEHAAVLDGGGSAPYAFYGDSTAPGPSDVTVRGFVVQNFRTPLQRGAIQDYNGPGWVIQDNHITSNSAAGVATGDKVRVLDNLIDHNGQEGFSAHGSDSLYQGNEIAYNNLNLAVDARWEAGGGKAWGTDNLAFRSNYVHDNGGPGLWADTNNINTVFDGNTISNNWGPGVYEEISYTATITNNTVTGNGMPSSPGGGQKLGWAWDAGIQLRASGGLSPSAPLVISRNTVADNYNGVTLIQGPSANACSNKNNHEGLYGSCRIRNVIVEDNIITMNQGATGEFQDGTDNSIFVSWNNRWLNNHYCVISAVHPADGYMEDWFAWMNSSISWPAWQNYGLDKGGTFRIGAECGR